MPLQGRLKYAIQVEADRAQGRMKAFHFAMDCDADLSALEGEAKFSQERLQEPIEISPEMAPGTTPRTYQEAYLKGLQDAIELILHLTQSSKVSRSQ